MKFVKFILPYLLISPVSVAVFFIAMFVSCISIEFVMHMVLTIFGIVSLISKTAQHIFVSAAGVFLSLGTAAVFMNAAVKELRHLHISFH